MAATPTKPAGPGRPRPAARPARTGPEKPDPGADLIERLVASIDALAARWDDGIHREYNRLAARIARPANLPLAPVLRRHLRRRLARRDTFGRDMIAEVLGRLAGPAALPALLSAAAVDLGDDQDGLSASITELLRTSPDACRAHALRAARGADPGLRRRAVWALTFLPVDPAGPVPRALCGALVDAEASVRAHAVWCIAGSGWSRDPKVLASLGEVARHDPDAGVRQRAAKALAPKPSLRSKTE